MLTLRISDYLSPPIHNISPGFRDKGEERFLKRLKQGRSYAEQ